MVGTHQELVLSCITIMLIKESSLTAIMKFHFWPLLGAESKILNLNTERSERQTISLTSDMVMISTLELKRTTLLGQPKGLKCFFFEFLREIYKMLPYWSLIGYQSFNLDKPYSECSTSSRHQFCDLMGAGKKIEILCQCHRDGFPKFNTTLR